jgi:hypothetical protein
MLRVATACLPYVFRKNHTIASKTIEFKSARADVVVCYELVVGRNDLGRTMDICAGHLLSPVMGKIALGCMYP